MANDGTIFISVASYCDELLWWTVRSAWQTAEQPQRLRFGVVDQSPSRASEEEIRGAWGKQLRYMHVLPKDSRGACWARALAFGLYAGEDHLLQIDSHTLFLPGWDRHLIDVLETVSRRSENRKVILSTRPFGFDLDADLQPSTRAYTQQSLRYCEAALRALSSRAIIPVPPFDAFPSGKEEPVRGFQLAAGFLFARGSFVDEVPYDPQLYFHGEEQTLAVRAFTHGWDIWHPNSPPVFHQYNRRKEASEAAPARPMHWDKAHDAERQIPWFDFERGARARMRQLLFTGSLAGVFGLGNVRTLADFRALSGIDYEQRSVKTDH